MSNLQFVNCEQGSKEWLNLKLGVISASNVHAVLAKKGTQARENYLLDLVSQVATKQSEPIDGQALRWGKENEAGARSAYEITTQRTVEQVSFIYGEGKRIGASPDGIIREISVGCEFKAPWNSRNHTAFLLSDKIKKEYVYQVQFCMYVTGFEYWDFCSYDKRFINNMFKIITVKRDNDIVDMFKNEIPVFVNEMDSALDKMQISWGSQWL